MLLILERMVPGSLNKENRMDKVTLDQLYIQKGKIVTNIEILQQNLKTVNQQIYQLISKDNSKEEDDGPSDS